MLIFMGECVFELRCGICSLDGGSRNAWEIFIWRPIGKISSRRLA